MAKKRTKKKKLTDEENLGDSKEEVKVSELVSLNKESEELSLSEKKSNELVKLEDTEKKASEKQERGAKILLFVILGIVAFLFIFGWVVSESNKFDYIGLTFVKEKFGEIPIYTAYVTGDSIYGTPIDYKLVLREDPRKSEIPVDANLRFITDKPIYLSLNMSSNIQECGARPMASFGLFTAGVGWNLETVVSTEDLAKELDRKYINCQNTPNATVLLLTKGLESKITQEGPNCYVLSVNNCELDQVLERFEIASLSTMTGRPLD